MTVHGAAGRHRLSAMAAAIGKSGVFPPFNRNREVTTVALSFAQKEAIVAEVAEVAKSAYSAVGAEYRGLTVEQMTDLRVQARQSGVYMRVVKNTLAKRAVEGTEFACIQEALVGPMILAFSQEDPGSAARVVEAFAKDHDRLQVKLVAIGGKLLDASELSTLAKMPTYEEAISQLMAVMKAPVQKLAATLNEVPGKLVRTIAAVRDAKEAA
jgi:large subunit ribosomal protein L10